MHFALNKLFTFINVKLNKNNKDVSIIVMLSYINSYCNIISKRVWRNLMIKQWWSTFHQFQHKTYNLITPQTTEHKKRDNLSRKLKWKAIQTYLDKFSYLCYYSSNGIPLNTNLSPTPTQVLSLIPHTYIKCLNIINLLV